MNRRTFILRGSSTVALLAAMVPASAATTRPAGDEVLGHGAFRYRADRFWGTLDPLQHPVEDCHAVVEDNSGRIIILTNDTHNNLLGYTKSGRLLSAWEHRFPAAHGLEHSIMGGEERLWITDHDRQVVSLCTLEGREIRRLEAAVVAKPYANMGDYHPTNVAVMPDGDFYVADGYGADYVHHVDPDWQYMGSFGGTGENPEHMNCPHAVWHDQRPGRPPLLVCDRGNGMLKWLSVEGKLEKVLSLPGSLPSNVALLGDHLVVASLNAMVLVLDAHDRVVSAIGGLPPVYEGNDLKPLRVYNHALCHPHDVHVDDKSDMYIPQWDSNHTYPVKLTRIV